ncbi:hypothetical protein [Shimia sp. SDUM112013]|uniref:hypothetical protein n=1 Tax=Shimia sp. SDUM112013 TaxID=3136160 RepID=UPI0032EDF8B1
MLQDKRKDLDAEKQKKLLERLLHELSDRNPSLYYQPTSEVALQVERYIAHGATLHAEERTLLERLGRRDIAVLLSLH